MPQQRGRALRNAERLRRELRTLAPGRDYSIELGTEFSPRRPQAGKKLVIGQEEAPPLPAFHTAYGGTVDPTDATKLLLAEQASLSDGMQGAPGLLTCKKGTTLRRMVVRHESTPVRIV